MRGVVARWAFAVVVAVCVAGVPQAWAQAQAVKVEDLAGAWEGTSKGSNGELPVKVDLVTSAGKITGTISAPSIVVTITDGKIEGDVLRLTLDAGGMTGTMSGKCVAAGRIEGTWELSSESGSIVMTKAGATAAPAAATGAGALAGEWAGEALVQGQAMPIAFTFKVEGGVVSGDIQSAMGKTAFTTASFKDGLLSLTFPYAGGEPITMGGKIVDGKLNGVFDYNSGEAQGTWWAAKK